MFVKHTLLLVVVLYCSYQYISSADRIVVLVVPVSNVADIVVVLVVVLFLLCAAAATGPQIVARQTTPERPRRDA